MLLERGADVNSWSAGDWRPLHRAVQGGHIGVAQFLVRRGADLDAINEDGHTAREMAEKRGPEFLHTITRRE
jgi:ankyrin repeat protein